MIKKNGFDEMMDRVATRQAPTVYMVQDYSFQIQALEMKNGRKPYALMTYRGNRVLRVLHGPCYYETPGQQLEALRVAQENKNRWPSETISVEQPGGRITFDEKPREPTMFDEVPDGADLDGWE